MDDDGEYRCRESDGEDKESLKNDMPEKLLRNCMRNLKNWKMNFLKHTKNCNRNRILSQNPNFTKNRLTSSDKNGTMSIISNFHVHWREKCAYAG